MIFPPLPKYTSLLGTRVWHRAAPAVIKGQLLMVLSEEPSLFCPDFSSLHSCRTGDMSWLTGKGS